MPTSRFVVAAQADVRVAEVSPATSSVSYQPIDGSQATIGRIPLARKTCSPGCPSLVSEVFFDQSDLTQAVSQDSTLDPSGNISLSGLASDFPSFALSVDLDVYQPLRIGQSKSYLVFRGMTNRSIFEQLGVEFQAGRKYVYARLEDVANDTGIQVFGAYVYIHPE